MTHFKTGADMVIAALTQLVHAPADDDGHGYQLAAAEDVLDLGGELDRPDQTNHENVMSRQCPQTSS